MNTNTNNAPQLAKLAAQVIELSDALRGIAQLCLNESAFKQYTPGELTTLKNAFGVVDKRLKLARSAMNELAFGSAEPLQ